MSNSGEDTQNSGENSGEDTQKLDSPLPKKDNKYKDTQRNRLFIDSPLALTARSRRIASARSKPQPEEFTFLGFTHSCGKTKRGYFKVKRRTARKKFGAGGRPPELLHAGKLNRA